MVDAHSQQHAPGTWTWEDFVQLGDGDRRELIDGELAEVDMPTELHERVVAMLVFFLVGWARARKAGVVHASGYKVRVSQKRGVMPDVQFYRRDNPAQRSPQGLESGRPDLAVEVVSPTSTSYDRITKLNWYASIGVPEYWIVEPEARTLERLLLQSDGRYVIANALADDAVLRPETLDGLEIALAELWGEEAP